MITSKVMTSPVIDGFADGMSVEGWCVGETNGALVGLEVMKTELLSIFQSSPIISSNRTEDAFTSFVFVASITRLTSA